MADIAKIKISLVQAPCELGDKTANIEVVIKQLTSLRGQSDLVVFGELFISGYGIDAESIHALAEPADGPTFQTISAAAKENRLSTIYGFPELEKATGKIYISLMWIDSDGKMMLCYRKTHLFDPDFQTFERVVFSAGDALAEVKNITTETGKIRVGVLVCWDVEVTEPSRCLALAGAELIIVIAANTDPKVNDIIMPSRCIDNQVHMAYCNMIGGAFCGRSVVIAPNGTVLAKLDGQEGVATATIMPQHPEYVKHRQRNQLWRDRRPELYSNLYL